MRERCDRCKKFVRQGKHLVTLPDECHPYNDGRFAICTVCADEPPQKLKQWAEKQVSK